MGLTDDRNDPGLRDVDPATGLQSKYLVLSDEERAKGFVRPVRTSYQHEWCGTITTMARAIAETYARQPSFYGGTYCSGCRAHRPVGEHGEFVWVENGEPTDLKVGTSASSLCAGRSRRRDPSHLDARQTLDVLRRTGRGRRSPERTSLPSVACRTSLAPDTRCPRCTPSARSAASHVTSPRWRPTMASPVSTPIMFYVAAVRWTGYDPRRRSAAPLARTAMESPVSRKRHHVAFQCGPHSSAGARGASDPDIEPTLRRPGHDGKHTSDHRWAAVLDENQKLRGLIAWASMEGGEYAERYHEAEALSAAGGANGGET